MLHMLCIIYYKLKAKLWTFGNLKTYFYSLRNVTYIRRFYSVVLFLIFSPFSPSEFLAENSQEKFWNFVEASQNIGSSDHHGKIEADASLTFVSGQ